MGICGIIIVLGLAVAFSVIDSKKSVTEVQ